MWCTAVCVCVWIRRMWKRNEASIDFEYHNKFLFSVFVRNDKSGNEQQNDKWEKEKEKCKQIRKKIRKEIQRRNWQNNAQQYSSTHRARRRTKQKVKKNSALTRWRSSWMSDTQRMCGILQFIFYFFDFRMGNPMRSVHRMCAHTWAVVWLRVWLLMCRSLHLLDFLY